MKRDFLTVGIGASAGGVKALKEFFSKMPPDSGMAFVVVLHLSQTHESNLAGILQRETQMPVVQVKETTKIEPNHVYVIPPAQQLEMVDSIVRLTKPQRIRGQRVAIDRFFRTLADSYGKSAVGIVLSGAGEDGTLGIKKIKEQNGFAIVQKPEDAEYADMPRSAIRTGIVDWVLPIEQMPEKLLSLRGSTEDLNLTEDDDGLAPELRDANAFRDVLTILRVRTGHDFSNYKHPTLLRRIARHLQIHELEDLSSYVQFLRANPDETEFLLKNLLINVTNFFRDKHAFEILEQDVIPRLFAGKTAEDHLRVWVAGCASGEEAYSIAMLLQEYGSRFDDVPKIQIFASDVDDEAIAQAREGRYGEFIVYDVSPDRLKRFFTKEGKHYRIKKELREMILFAPHNILRDPPFSKLDLITCRNLMIYLNRDTQEQLMQLFHFALKPDGFLFLGSSETADSVPLLFSPYNKKQRIYLRRPTNPVAHSGLSLSVGDRREQRIEQIAPKASAPTFSFSELHFRMLEKYAPPSILVNEDYDVVHLSENAGRFLQFAGGEPSNNLLRVIHPDLRADLRAALFTAKQDGQTAVIRRLTARIEGSERFIDLRVHPIATQDAGGKFMLVIFEDYKAPENGDEIAPLARRTGNENGALDTLERHLEDELRRTKDRLRVTVEQYDTSIEELKASNEELQAINEELRSATEELETSKEELQSVNEELTTVNNEFKEKIEEVSHVNSDLHNLMQSTDIAVMFLDRNLQIKRFTKSVQDIFNVIQTDIGRPIGHLTHRLEYNDLAEDARQVLRSLKPVERELVSADGKYYFTRVLPYRTIDERINGVVITFLDTTERKLTELSKFFLASIVESSQDSIISIDFDRKITSWNKGAENLYGYTAAEAIGKPLTMLTLPEDLNLILANVDKVKNSQEVVIFDSIRLNKSGREMNLEVVLSPVKNDAGEVIGVSTIARDVTERRKAEEALRESEERFSALVNQSTAGICRSDLDGKLVFVNQRYCEMLGYTESEIIGKTFWELTYDNDSSNFEENKRLFERLRTEGEPFQIEKRLIRKDGQPIWANVSVAAMLDHAGKPQSTATVVVDISERIQAEAKLRHSQEMFSALVSNAPFGVYLIDSKFRLISVNHGAQAVFSGIDPLIGRDFEEILRQVWEEPFATEALARFHHTLRTGESYYSPTIIGQRMNIDKVESYDWQLHRITLPDETYGVVCYFYDLTEQRQMQQALRESEERFRSIVTQVTAGIAEVDLTGRFNFVNDRYAEIVGYSPKELLGGMRMQDITHPDDLKINYPLFEKCITEGKPFVIEKRYIRKDGTEIWVNNSVSPELDEDGKTRYVTSVTIDITERRKTEEALRESEERLGAMFEQASVGIVQVTLDGQLVMPNAGFCKIIDYNEDEVCSLNMRDICHPEDYEKEVELTRQLFAGEIPDFTIEKRYIRKDGSVIWGQKTTTLIRRGTEEPLYALAIVEDISERKRTQEALREGDRRKDEFLATLAHELRNPLAPIRTAIEIMRRGEDKLKGQHAREIIERQTGLLIHLVDDLLDISRITQGKINLRKECIDIADSIKAAIETVNPFVESQRHSLDVRLPDDAVFVEADRNRLTQIVFNLLHNSAKYTEPGGHILLIAAREADEAVIRVRDNGIGIQFEMLPAIFDMFAQTAVGEKRAQGGLGIGLSLVKKLVEMHGGTVEAHSEGEGKGSEFIVRLPLAAQQKPERKKEKQVFKKAADTEKPRRILVVDDNADAANMLEVFLSMESHEVATAYNGRDALEKAAELKPDTAILDIGLPDMNGFELAKLLRAEFPEACLIALSGWGQDEDRRRSNEAGFNHHLVKPVDVEELKKILCS
ncbi:MAG: PAS domain S-box protein [Acidobacteriota bacterium]|nr:PAS domain S-box protein [Acidobacteriota bacterium]